MTESENYPNSDVPKPRYITAKKYAEMGSPVPARWECPAGHGGLWMHKVSTGGNCWCGKVLMVVAEGSCKQEA